MYVGCRVCCSVIGKVQLITLNRIFFKRIYYLGPVIINRKIFKYICPVITGTERYALDCTLRRPDCTDKVDPYTCGTYIILIVRVIPCLCY